jgi:hypothetical protein
MYVVHLLVCFLRLKSRYAFRPQPVAVICWSSGAALVLAASAANW